MFKLIQLDDGKHWLTDGNVGIECETAFKLLGMINELSDCNCSASISDGLLVLEDGTNYDLKQLLKDAKN